MTACTLNEDWALFLAVALVTLLGGLVILIPSRLCWYLLFGRQRRVRISRTHGVGYCFARMRAQALNLISAHSMGSKALVMTLFLFNMVAIVIYLIDATEFSRLDCGTVRDDPLQLIWLSLCCVFICFYIIRFVAAADKLFMWLDLYSVVDHLTIGPTFYAFYVNSNWLGLKFLRLLWLLKLPEMLQLMSILKSQRTIRLAQVLTIFIGSWMASSGFVHITENNGDPHQDWKNDQSLTYWECVYWLLVTMSTVGYGEISPSTDITRAFIVIFIMGSFVMFTSMIPEIASGMSYVTSKYQTAYKRTYGKKHIIVCGHITYETVSHFLENFIHKESDTSDTDIVFVDPEKPDLELEAFFKRHFNDVTFIRSTVMDVKTLVDMKVQDADSCIILANRKAADSNEEDGANIIRVTAIKNYCPTIRVIVQLLFHHNKLHLLHIPNWNWQDNGDEVVCISQLKLGIMAQNCLAPGFCTLLSNLFTMRSYPNKNTSDWLTNYRYGAGHEIYVESFSEAFHGLTFTQAVEICYIQWDVLLVALNIRDHRGKRRMKVNPGSTMTIGPNTTGFFLAQTPEQVRKITKYQPDETAPGDDFLMSKTKAKTSISSLEVGDDEDLQYLEHIGARLANYGYRERSPAQDSDGSDLSEHREVFDLSGMLHWCTTRPLQDCILDHEEARVKDFHDHVVLCLAACADSPVSGLVNFIIPLRSSNFRYEELKDIVILTEADYIKKEWRQLANFPKIYIFEGNAIFRSDLRAISLNRCAMCAIMSAGRPMLVDQTAVDKEAVLTTLNVKGMFGEHLEQQIKSLGILTNPETFRKQVTATSEIPIITELKEDSDVLFLDQDDEDDPSVPLYLTLPYISGQLFADSVLDALMSSTYLSPETLTLIRALTIGAETDELEQILTDGMGIVRRKSIKDNSAMRDRSRLTQLSLQYGPLEKLQHNYRYGELLTAAIRRYGIMCLGLHRLIDPSIKDPRKRRRYVMTNPAFNTQLDVSDKVYVLIPFHMEDGSKSVTPRRSRTSSLQALSSLHDVDTAHSSTDEATHRPHGVTFAGQGTSNGLTTDRNGTTVSVSTDM